MSNTLRKRRDKVAIDGRGDDVDDASRRRVLALATGLGIASAGALVMPGSVLNPNRADAISDRSYDFFVSAYGAVGDNTTDDTAAIQDAIDAAVNYASSHNGFARVVFDDRNYRIGGPMRSVSGVIGQLIIPAITSGPQLSIELAGPGHMASAQNVNSSPQQGSGAVLRSDSTATYSGSGPSPSILAVGQGVDFGRFSRVKVSIRNLGFRGNSNPSIAGLMLINAAQVDIDCVRVDTTDSISDIVQPTHPVADAIVLPAVDNNAMMKMRQVCVTGWYCGVKFGENSNIDGLIVYMCMVGVSPQGNNYHLSHFKHVFVLHCPYSISASYSTIGVTEFAPGTFLYFKMDAWDIEDAPSGVGDWSVPIYHINDPNNTFKAHITYLRVISNVGTTTAPLLLNGAGNCHLTDLAA
ncbi:MAG: glycosyl hydrolase family 28-related protein [Microbacterium sp.]